MGVGFDTKGSAVASHKTITVQKPSESNVKHFVIPDSREGLCAVQPRVTSVTSATDIAIARLGEFCWPIDRLVSVKERCCIGRFQYSHSGKLLNLIDYLHYTKRPLITARSDLPVVQLKDLVDCLLDQIP